VIRFAEDGETYTSIRFRPHESTLKIDRKFSGSRRAIVHQRRCLVESAEDELRLRIILDRFSCEVFINGGEKVMTATFFTDMYADKISFRADGDVVIDVVKYDIVP
jgi:beta-fructofuranosidase